MSTDSASSPTAIVTVKAPAPWRRRAEAAAAVVGRADLLTVLGILLAVARPPAIHAVCLPQAGFGMAPWTTRQEQGKIRAVGMSTDSPNNDPGVLLKVRDLRTHFPVRRGLFGRVGSFLRAVDGVSFDIPRGTTLGLVGESGCGKTTLGRTILRLTEPTGGSVWFDGTDVLAASTAALRRLRRDAQIVFQDTAGSLNPRITIGRTVAEPLEVHKVAHGKALRERVATLLERVGLRAADADRYPHELSGGQRQRVGIARAIALKPRFIVYDEPVSALDVSIQSQVLNLLDDLRREYGLTYLFIAHDLAVVKHVSDRVAVMYLGRIVETAAADELYRRPRHPYTAALLAAVLSPEPTPRRDRLVLGGDPPNPVDSPGGCAFHPRCPFATDECHHVAPTLEPHPGLPPDHLVACHQLHRIPRGDEAIDQSRDSHGAVSDSDEATEDGREWRMMNSE